MAVVEKPNCMLIASIKNGIGHELSRLILPEDKQHEMIEMKTHHVSSSFTNPGYVRHIEHVMTILHTTALKSNLTFNI